MPGCGNSADISFAGKLWQVFRAVITGALDSLKAVMGDAVAMVMDAIDAHIECWFLQVLQLDARTLKLGALEGWATVTQVKTNSETLVTIHK